MINWKDPEINLHLKEFISNGDYKEYYNIIINNFRVTDDEIILDILAFKRKNGIPSKLNYRIPMFIFNARILPVIRDNKINDILNL
jgi:hypothetical protein